MCRMRCDVVLLKYWPTENKLKHGHFPFPVSFWHAPREVFKSTTQAVWLYSSQYHDSFSCSAVWGRKGHTCSTVVFCFLDFYNVEDDWRCNLAFTRILFEQIDRALTKFGTMWWATTHLCLQRLSICWMLLLYQVMNPLLLPINLLISESSSIVLLECFIIYLWVCGRYQTLNSLNVLIFTKYSEYIENLFFVLLSDD